ncbi:hypothetical protein ACMD2_16427 [Ananas comosus]|uniref:Uncharacterized protein n=1 Tax=Ananas comosus TaxID=4615 RepID=A0A199V8C3_ANACO|nr:hypothetical protein ACMD2_16427 [Ananas comosus]
MPFTLVDLLFLVFVFLFLFFFTPPTLFLFSPSPPKNPSILLFLLLSLVLSTPSSSSPSSIRPIAASPASAIAPPTTAIGTTGLPQGVQALHAAVEGAALTEAGMRRWEYRRTSDSSYLAEAFVFYEAVLDREYLRDAPSAAASEVALAHKQLRLLVRFLNVSLVLGCREMVLRLASLLRIILEEHRRSFQEKYVAAEKLLSLSLKEWETTLVASDALHPVWIQALGDPFLRRFILRDPVTQVEPKMTDYWKATHLRHNGDWMDGRSKDVMVHKEGRGPQLAPRQPCQEEMNCC